jgi:hypothetical protein
MATTNTSPTTITQTVKLELTGAPIDTDSTRGTVVLNGTISYSQSVTGNYSADGKTFTPTDYGTPQNIQTDLETTGGTGSNQKLNVDFGPLNTTNTINLHPGTKEFDNVGLAVINQTSTGFDLQVSSGKDDSPTTGKGGTYDLLKLNVRENQAPIGTAIPVDANGRIDFVQSVSLNSGAGASIQQFNYDAQTGTFSSFRPADGYTAPGATDAATLGVTDQVVCYSKGTHLKAQSGDVKVEDLKIGDMLLTVEGQYKPVVWIGFRTIDCRQQKNKEHAYPVRVSQHAFGYNLPARDLFLSPLHSIYASGVMIPVIHLVNGTTITQDQTETLVTYYHIELPTHDAVFAEGLPAETYLDTTPENRHFFEQGKDLESKVFEMNTQLPTWPQEIPVWQYIWDTQGYAPLTQEGPVLEAVKTSLKEHAALAQERQRLAA